MPYTIGVTSEFKRWYQALDADVRRAISAKIDLLAEVGWRLGRPHADTLSGSRYRNLKELRVKSGGRQMRIFFAFDPRRMAVILAGGDKSGERDFYDRLIPLAETLYERHLRELERQVED